MKRSLPAFCLGIFLVSVTGCGKKETRTLVRAKRGFRTKIVREEDTSPVSAPPPKLFRLVAYPTPFGNLPAYRTTPIADGKKRPAIIWIVGGDSNSVGSIWEPVDPTNDQSATQYPKAGIVTMFPVLRGGNETKMIRGNWAINRKESFLGEVDDILAAATWLAKQPDVDPNRIFLGGHSTGGTLALLVAATSPRFRAVFSFGPVSDVAHYGGDYLTCEQTDAELYVRSPGNWLNGIQSPTYVFEGSESGNSLDVMSMKWSNRNPNVHFEVLSGYSHFTILAPQNAKLARAIVGDTGVGVFTLTPS